MAPPPCVVNVATGRYVRGLDRLRNHLPPGCDFLAWRDQLPPGSPSHHDIPYAFKTYALKEAERVGYRLLLWADASILPVGDLNILWDLVRKQGYWVCRNGWRNAEWTCDAAYADLGISREDNWVIPHVVATAFALDLDQEVGRRCLDEYYRLAKTRAFCGPWTNKRGEASSDPRVLGHRHDQTALSLIVHRLGMQLTDPPRIFAYRQVPRYPETILEADGSF